MARHCVDGILLSAHSVITTSSILEIMRWQIGSWAFGLGLLGALICGVQVYATKLFKRKAAESWMYAHIRHPFYLSLAVAGFGLLTIWPRIIILVLYLGMLFLYYFLARFEEKQVEAAHPEYAEYRKRTGMFLRKSRRQALSFVLQLDSKSRPGSDRVERSNHRASHRRSAGPSAIYDWPCFN